MKRISWIIAVSIFLVGATGRDKDGFRSVRQDAQIENLLKAAAQKAETNTAMAIQKAEMALRLSIRANDSEFIAKSHYYLGKLYGIRMCRFKKGAAHLERALVAIQKIKAPEYLPDIHYQLANFYYNIAQFENALKHLSICEELYQGSHDVLSEYFVRALTTAIQSQWLPDSFEQAQNSFSNILRFAEEIKNDSLFVTAAHYFTSSLMANGEYKKAEEFVNRAFSMTRTSNRCKDVAQMLYIDLGDIFLHERLFRAAISQYQSAVDMAVSDQQKIGLNASLYKLGVVYDSLGEATSAKQHYARALNGFTELGMPIQVVDVYRSMALFERRHGNMDRALELTERQAYLKDTLVRYQTASLINLQARMEDHATVIRQKEENISWLSTNLILIVSLALCLLFLYQMNKRRLLAAKNRSMLVSEITILEKQVQNEKIQRQRLMEQLEFNAKAMTITSLNMIEKNEILLQIKEKIAEIRGAAVDGTQLMNTKELSQLVNLGLNIDKDWDNFKIHFEQVHNGFFEMLKSKYPHLNSSDLKLCALLKLNLDTKEIASVMNISAASVKVARSRLRKKLELDLSENLSAFITQI